MKVTSVEIQPIGSSQIMKLSFRDPRRVNPYNVKSITGLDADEIVRHYYGGSGANKRYNLTLPKRDLVISIELNPGYGAGQSYSSLRDEIYKMISASRTGVVDVRFKNGESTTAVISGFVSKVETPHFSKNPDIQLTIDCPEPLLKSPTAFSYNVTNMSPANTVVTDDLSTAPHGLSMVIQFLDHLASFTLGAYEWSFVVTPINGFLLNDTLHINSETNKKELYLKRSGLIVPLADRIATGSVWPMMFPGINAFTCTSGTKLKWVSLSHYPTYWGV